MLQIRSMRLEDAKVIANWRYPAPYDVYDFLDWETMAASGWGITIPEKRAEEFRVMWDNDCLAAWFRLFTKHGESGAFLGLGLAPELCGQGKGKTYVQQMAVYALAEMNTALHLEVRDFNRRAIRCYQAVGFREEGLYEKEILGKAYRMIRMTYRK